MPFVVSKTAIKDSGALESAGGVGVMQLVRLMVVSRVKRNFVINVIGESCIFLRLGGGLSYFKFAILMLN